MFDNFTAHYPHIEFIIGRGKDTLSLNFFMLGHLSRSIDYLSARQSTIFHKTGSSGQRGNRHYLTHLGVSPKNRMPTPPNPSISRQTSCQPMIGIAAYSSGVITLCGARSHVSALSFVHPIILYLR